MVSSPSPCPASTEVAYSKIGAASCSSLECSSGKIGYVGHEDMRRKKIRAFCAGYGGWAVACALALLGICLMVILLMHTRASHDKRGIPHRPGSSGSPFIAPATSPLPAPATSPSPAPEAPSMLPPSPSQALPLRDLCNTTDQSQLCLEVLSTFPSTEPIVALQDLTAFVARGALLDLNQTYTFAVNLSRGGGGDENERAALQDCLELLDEARDGLNDSINQLSHLELHEDPKVVRAKVMDVRVWMSSSYTQQDTCWDGFQDAEGPLKDQLLKSGQPIAPLIALALSFANLLQQLGLSSFYALHSAPP